MQNDLLLAPDPHVLSEEVPYHGRQLRRRHSLVYGATIREIVSTHSRIDIEVVNVVEFSYLERRAELQSAFHRDTIHVFPNRQA